MVTGATKSRGFTLTELVLTLAVIGVLATVAYPNYMERLRKSRRTDAVIALLDIANLQERFFLDNTSYSDNLNANSCQLGYGIVSANGFYDISLTGTPNTNDLDGSGPSCVVNTAATGYLVTATATAGQLGDGQCRTLRIDQSGNRTSTDSSSNPSTGCW